ncbi:hypothetical protein [Bacillus sp. FJAT-29814]|uniref:hypothetical protein n=1 Tax=Bacillus sp. FJAT-29814 TaxID=1729688 RepID=UPI0008379755|nr:hypothetical protein [Bacillus sp. FJAT-29814]
MLIKKTFPCACGWCGEWVTGGLRKQRSLVEIVEDELIAAKHQNPRAAWRSVYQKLLLGQVVPEEVSCRSGMFFCFECKSGFEQLVVCNSSGNPLHPMLCHECGSEGEFFPAPVEVPCPRCRQMVGEGKPLSTQEILNRMLSRCEITTVDKDRDKLLVVVGSRCQTYLEPILDDIHYSVLAVTSGENITHPIDFWEKFASVEKVLLQTSPDTIEEAELALLLVQQLQAVNIEMIPIVITPPLFEGKRRTQWMMEHIQELQSFVKQVLIVSGAGLDKQYGPLEVYRKHVPIKLRELLK